MLCCTAPSFHTKVTVVPAATVRVEGWNCVFRSSIVLAPVVTTAVLVKVTGEPARPAAVAVTEAGPAVPGSVCTVAARPWVLLLDVVGVTDPPAVVDAH